MNVHLSTPRGFCAGVRMAIECLNEVIRRIGPEVYVYHQIIHNTRVVDDFLGRGVTFVESLEEVPPGSVLLFSAHGVSPEVRRLARERRLQTIDATCPLVTKVHLEAIRYANEGYHIILIGHEGHAVRIVLIAADFRRSVQLWESKVICRRSERAGIALVSERRDSRHHGRCQCPGSGCPGMRRVP